MSREIEKELEGVNHVLSPKSSLISVQGAGKMNHEQSLEVGGKFLGVDHHVSIKESLKCATGKGNQAFT